MGVIYLDAADAIFVQFVRGMEAGAGKLNNASLMEMNPTATGSRGLTGSWNYSLRARCQSWCRLCLP